MLKNAAGKAAASEEARRTLRDVEPLSEARTPVADFFSILLDRASLPLRCGSKGNKEEKC